MDIYVFDSSFEILRIVDVYSSLIWTQRYQDLGDFEIIVPATSDMIDLFRIGRFVGRACDVSRGVAGLIDASDMMIVTGRQIKTDAEDGDDLIITGQDLKSILKRRVISSQTVLSGTVASCIETLLNDNIIDAVDTDRNIDGFTFGATTVGTNTMKCQFTGDNLLEAITDICVENGLGFKVTLESSEFFNFILYEGTDRSKPPFGLNPDTVIISPEFDNLLSSEYKEDTSNFANVAYVAGEGQGSARTIKETSIGSPTGLDRFEIWCDARNASSNEGEISEADYLAQLATEGQEALADAVIVTDFEGEIVENPNYPFNLGDIVTIITAQGIERNVRVTEMIYSIDDEGLTIVPTFREENI